MQNAKRAKLFIARKVITRTTGIILHAALAVGIDISSCSLLTLVSVALCSSADLQSPRAAQWHLRGRAQSCVASWTQGESRPTLPKPAGRLSQGQDYRPVNVTKQSA